MNSEYIHTFVLTAYKEGPFLGECIESLMNQTVKSKIFITTSTPNEHIYSYAKKYSLEVFVNKGVGDITDNWNFAVSNVNTKYYTIAHQDDIYEPQYAEKVIEAAEKSKDPIIMFTKYFEIRDGERVYKNKLLKVKNFLNFPLLLFKRSRFVRNRVLSLGSPICTPSVTYCLDKCRNYHFDNNFWGCCDWDYFSRVAGEKGSFVYVNDALMGHRIHSGSGTTETIENGNREKEELIMFKRFWPDWIAKKIASAYKKAMKSN